MKAQPETPQEIFLKHLHRAVFAFDRKADQLLAKAMDASFSQFLLLAAVYRCPGASQQKIASGLNLTPPAISRQIDNLVRAGYIVRAEDPDSRRAHTIRLTSEGEKRHAAMHELLLRSLHHHIDAISSKELESATTVLRQVLDSLDAQRAAS